MKAIAAIAFVAVLAAPALSALQPWTTTDHGSNWVPSRAEFESFMAEGGPETTLHGHEDIPELRQKLVKRVLSWGEEFLTREEQHPFVSKLFAANMPAGSELSHADVKSILHEIIHE